jgi:hypothetical protein
MDKVQKPSNFECHTPSSEPFIIYILKCQTIKETPCRLCALAELLRYILEQIWVLTNMHIFQTSVTIARHKPHKFDVMFVSLIYKICGVNME